MAISCSIDAHVKNKQGEVVVSNLWTDLMKFTDNNRELTKQYYAIGTNEDFLKSVGKRARFDENGQITFNSLKKLARLNKIEDDRILSEIRSSFRASSLSYEDALDSVESFNSSSRFNDKFLAIIKEESDGTFSTDIVLNNKANRTALKNIKRDKLLRDHLLDRLKALHCNVEFIENPDFRGQYDSTDVQRLYDDTYTLIRIAKDLPLSEQTKVLAKEIGHFTIGVLGNDDTLVKRLENLVKSPVFQEAYRNAHPDDTLLGDPAREIMGHLIGEALYSKMTGTEKSPLNRILQLIKAKIKSKFKTAQLNDFDYLRALNYADSITSNIASGFLHNKAKYDLKKALERDEGIKAEKLYDSTQSQVRQKLNDIINERKRLVGELEKISPKAAKSLRQKVNNLEKLVAPFDGNSYEDLIFLLRAVRLAENQINEELTDISMSLSKLNEVSDYELRAKQKDYSNQAFVLMTKLKALTRCTKTLSTLLSVDAFKKLNLPQEKDILNDEDIFIGTNDLTATSAIIDLNSYDNTTSTIFAKLDELDKKFRDVEGNVNRTSGQYIDNEGNPFVRYHRVIDHSEYAKVPSSENLEFKGDRRKAERGTRTDAFLREFFDNKGTDAEAALTAANREEVELEEGEAPNLFGSEDFEYLEHLKESALKLMHQWAKQGIKWRTKNLVISTHINGVKIAGEIDILLEYPDGHTEVWDMKTSGTSEESEYSPLKNPDYETQVNFYARTLRDNGINARVGGILWIDPTTGSFKYVVKPNRPLEQCAIHSQLDKIKLFLDALAEQEDVEKSNHLKTLTSEETSKDTSFIPDRFSDDLTGVSIEQVIEYVKKYHPKYRHAVQKWFDYANMSSTSTDTQRVNGPLPIHALVAYNIVPKTFEEKSNLLNSVKEDEVATAKTDAFKLQSEVFRLASIGDSIAKRMTSIWMKDVAGVSKLKVDEAGIKYGINPENQKDVDRRKKRFYHLTKDRYADVDSLVEYIDRDLTRLEGLFRPTTRNFDIPTQLLTRSIESLRMMADQATLEDIKKLWDIRYKYNLSREEELALYERDERGNFTGHFKSEVNYGRYEADLKEFRENAHKEFIKYMNANFKDEHGNSIPPEKIDRTVIDIEWANWYGKKWKEWHKGTLRTIKDEAGNNIIVSTGHSSTKTITNPETESKTKVFVPNIDYKDKNGVERYRSTEYDKLSQKQKDFLNEILEIKGSLDLLLGDAAHTTTQRAPQIRAFNIRDLWTNHTPDNLLIRIKQKFLSDAFAPSEDDDYGSDITDIELQDWFGNSWFGNIYESEARVSEVPLYFVKFLSNPNKMSTDIIGSMIAYSNMAHHYKMLGDFRSTTELISKTLTNRRRRNNSSKALINQMIDPISGTEPLNPTEASESPIYNRNLRNYLETQLYSRRTKPLLKWGQKGILLDKVQKLFSDIMISSYLGGNVHGASVNLATGINEIWKEAMVSQDIPWEAAVEAHAKYIPWSIKMFSQAFRRMPDDKLSLWYLHFNVRGDNAYQYKHKDFTRAIPHSWTDLLMAPYSMGDAYMQGMSYLSVALGTKVYKKDGSSCSLYSAYKHTKSTIKSKKYDSKKVEDSTLEATLKGQVIGDLSVEDNTYFASAEFAKDYDTLRAIKNKIITEYNLKTDVTINLTPEEQELLTKYGVNFRGSKPSEILLFIDNLFDKNIVGREAYEVDYAEKCRELNDRMHGIYNKANKTALHSSLLGVALTSLRGFLFGYIERDFANNRYDIRLGRNTEGIWQTYVKYIGYEVTKNWDLDKDALVESALRSVGRTVLWGAKALLLSSVAATLGTIPIVSNVVNKSVKKLTGKDISYKHLMQRLTDLGDYQIYNIQRGAAINNLVFILEMFVAPFLLKWGNGDDDDPTNNKLLPLLLYYIIQRAAWEQLSATMLLSSALSLTGVLNDSFGDGANAGWAQEINRNSSFVPAYIINAMEIGIDAQFLLGMIINTSVTPEPQKSWFPSEDLYKEAVQNWKEENKAYLKYHYQANNYKWKIDPVTGKPLTYTVNGKTYKVPIHDTAFKRAMWGEYMEGDPRYLKRLCARLPYIKSLRVAGDPVEKLKNYFFGQKMNR